MKTWRVEDPYGNVLSRAQIERATGAEPPPGFDQAEGLTWEQTTQLAQWLRDHSMAHICRADEATS